MAIPRIRTQNGTIIPGYTLNDKGGAVPTNQGFATKEDVARLFGNKKDKDESKKPKSKPRANVTDGQIVKLLTSKLDTMIRHLDGIQGNTERTMNMLAYQTKAKKKSLEEQEKEDISRNKEESKIRRKRMHDGFGAFGSFFRALAGWGKIVETLLIPVIMGVIAALVKAKHYLGAIGVAVGSLFMSKGIRRVLGNGLSALGRAIRNKFSGKSKTVKEEDDNKRLKDDPEASKKGVKEIESVENSVSKEGEKITSTTSKTGQKVFRDASGRFVKKEVGEAAMEAEKAGTWLGKFSKAFEVVSKVFKVVGRFFVLVDVINTIIGTVQGAISGYKNGGILGAIQGGARGFLNSFVGWIWDLGTWAIGSLFKLFGADKVGDAIKKFNFDKLLDKMVDWVGEGIQAIGHGVHAAVQAMKDSIASLLDHLPAPIKKLIPGSVWSALGRMPDGSKQPDLNKQASMAYQKGGAEMLMRVQATGKNYELNMNAKQQEQFEAGIKVAKSGVFTPDTNSMAQALMSANPGLSKKDALHYINSAVLPLAKMTSGQDNVGSNTTAPLFKTGLKIGNIDTDKLWSEVSPEIAQGESGKAGYDAHHGSYGGVEAGLTNHTIAQIINSTGAAGKYQILPSTLKEIYAKVGLKLSDKFSPENQEKLGRYLFDRRVKAGAKNGIAGIQEQLSKEWASLPKDQTGVGAYDGYAGNQAFGGAARGSLIASQIQSASKGPMMPPSNRVASVNDAGQKNTLINAPTYNTNTRGGGGGPNQLGLTAAPPSATMGPVT